MDNHTSRPETTDEHASASNQRRPRRHRVRRGIAVVATAALVSGLAVPFAHHLRPHPDVQQSAAEASTQPVSDPYGGYGPYGGSGYQPYQPYGGLSGGLSGGSSTDSQSVAATATDASTDESAGVVLIETTLTSGSAAGTGLVLTSDGTILTNYHVVEDSTSIEVTVASTGETYSASVVGHDAEADVAMLALQGASGLRTVTLDDDGDPIVGDDVTAVGNAEGQGYLSASTGVVEALDRSITTSSEYGIEGEDLSGLIEFDAAVVGGYSGGALLDDEGEVVGITTAASSGSVADSYAIPVADALAIVSLIEAGTAGDGVQIGPAAYLGVAVASASGAATVAEVEDGTAAAGAGLVAGDTITGVGSSRVTSYADLADAVAARQSGDTVRLTWTDSSGVGHSARVTLGSSPVN